MEGLTNLGIDLKSILMYIVNTGILIGVLTYFLYKPVMKLMEERQKRISDNINEADRIKGEFEKRLAEMEAEKNRVQAKLKEDLSQFEKFTSDKKAELVLQMEAERDKVLHHAHDEMARKKENLIKDIEVELLKTIQKIVLEIVQNKVPKEVVQQSVDEAWGKYEQTLKH